MHVDDVGVLLDVLGVDVGVDVAAGAIDLIDRIDAVLNDFAPDDVALLQREIAGEGVGLEQRGAGDCHFAEVMDRPFLDRDRDAHALLLHFAGRDDLRLAERDARVRSPGSSS